MMHQVGSKNRLGRARKSYNSSKWPPKTDDSGSCLKNILAFKKLELYSIMYPISKVENHDFSFFDIKNYFKQILDNFWIANIDRGPARGKPKIPGLVSVIFSRNANSVIAILVHES